MEVGLSGQSEDQGDEWWVWNTSLNSSTDPTFRPDQFQMTDTSMGLGFQQPNDNFESIYSTLVGLSLSQDNYIESQAL